MAAPSAVPGSRTEPPIGAVLYVDHARHLSPLTLAYHATASRHLTSGRTDVVPPSTKVEVDSAYCPRCLTYYDAASASLGFCSQCKECPICFSPVSVSIDAVPTGMHLVCHYACGFCRWSSQECGVVSSADRLLELPYSANLEEEKEREEQRKVIIGEASGELERCLREKVSKRSDPGETLFRAIAGAWRQLEKEGERSRWLKGVEMGGGRAGVGRRDDGWEGWSIESLEQALTNRKKERENTLIHAGTSAISEASPPPAGDEAYSASMMSADAQNLDVPTAQQAASQMILTTAPPRYRSDLFPLPVPFRARVSRRCVAELAAGRAGILIKPKLNPLEGDSSLRGVHGQWWKKDSSAIHVVPRVQLCQQESDDTHQYNAILLKVRNPTLNMIRLRFSGPSSNTDAGGSSTDTTSPIIHPRELDDVLIDPFNETFVNAFLSPYEATALLSPTKWLVLEHAEDPFLDIGKGQEKDPEEVSSWSASSVLQKAREEEKAESALRVIATRRDTAWVELLLWKNSVEGSTAERTYMAAPISLQIEVGNGSWEASLIKRRDLPQGEADIVTLDLALLLRS